MSLDPITSALDLGSEILKRIFPDPKQRAEHEQKLFELQHNGELAKLEARTSLLKGQIQVNAEEAKHSSLFVSGWRSFVGWTCGAAFAYHMVLQPFLIFILAANGKQVVVPSINFQAIGKVLMGMLGLDI